jgi:hypothetical protein
MGNQHSSAQLSCFSQGRKIIAKEATSFSGAAVHQKVKAIMQVLIELRLASDKISSLCQVPEDSLVGLLPVNYSPIEINSLSMQILISTIPQMPKLVDQILKLEATSISKGSTHRTQTIQMSNGDTFTGKLLGGLPAGEGTYTYAEDGRVCVGSWLNGQMQGHCEITWPNGKRLKGHFDGNRLINDARINWADGGAYEGKVTEDYQLTGLGILRMPKRETPQFMHDLVRARDSLNHTRNDLPVQRMRNYDSPKFDYVYIGHFTDGMMQGYGVVITPSGFYEGEWQQDLFHGQGTYVLACSWLTEYYSGSWVDGVMHGFGISNCYEGCRRYGLRCGIGADEHYTGEFKDDQYHGYGVLRDASCQYEGEWRNGLKEGSGTCRLQTGNEYVGHFSLNKKSGYGVMHYANANETTVDEHGVITDSAGDIYEGYWEDDLKSGSGTLKRKDGSIWTGTWRKDRLLYQQIVMSNGDLYEGERIDKVPNGEGTMTYAANGAKYQGKWLNGQRHGGIGTLEYPSGEWYQGIWRFNQRCGQGSMKWPDGTKYEGLWMGDRMNGRGTYTWTDGRVFKGIFNQGELFRGTMKMPNGDVLSGEWQNKQGEGTHAFSDGRVLSGLWQHDQAHGECTMSLPSRENYSGRCEAGEMVGEVVYRWPNGRVYTGYLSGMQDLSFSQLKMSDFETYKGSMLDLQPQGLGTLYQAALKYVVHGSWLDSKIEGYAKKTLAEGEWYKGWWRDNKLHGQGTYGWSDGTVYSGHWEDNMRTGPGVMKMPDGSKYRGEWFEDQLLETTAQVQQNHWAAVYLKQVDERIYHSEDKPRREFIYLQSYQVYAKNFSDQTQSLPSDDNSSWSDPWEDED